MLQNVTIGAKAALSNEWVGPAGWEGLNHSSLLDQLHHGFIHHQWPRHDPPVLYHSQVPLLSVKEWANFLGGSENTYLVSEATPAGGSIFKGGRVTNGPTLFRHNSPTFLIQTAPGALPAFVLSSSSLVFHRALLKASTVSIHIHNPEYHICFHDHKEQYPKKGRPGMFVYSDSTTCVKLVIVYNWWISKCNSLQYHILEWKVRVISQ